MARVFYAFRGRVCLKIALKALGVKAGDYVACQAFTCIAVPDAIESLGAIPIFIDIEKDTLCISKIDLNLKINKKIKALIIQHTYGIKCDLKSIYKICSNYSIPIIEDNCHLPFSIKDDTKFKYSSLQFYSFEWGKPFPHGLGGALVVKDKNLSRKCNELIIKLKKPTFMAILKIEIQYYAFKFLYTPETYFLLKKLFHFFNKLGFSIGNKTEYTKSTSKKEYEWQISPLVRKRILNTKHNQYEIILEHNNLIKRIYLENIPQNKKLNFYISETNYLMKYPILTKNKTKIYNYLKSKNIEVSDWYRTPVDPLSIKDCLSKGWNIDTCKNAKDLAKNILTLPTNKKISIKKAEEISSIFKSII